MHIEVSQGSETLIQAALASQRGQSARDYVESLIREDSLTRHQLSASLVEHAEKLEHMALSGLNSGEALDVDVDYWQQKRDNLSAHNS